MKSTHFILPRIKTFAVAIAAMVSLQGAANAIVTLQGNAWVVTSGTNTQARITGTLFADGLLDANTITATSLAATGAITTTGAISATGTGTITSTGQLWSKSTLLVTGASTLTGNTTTQGDLSVYKGIDLGRSVGNPALSAMQVDYYTTAPNLKTASFDLTDSLGKFRWQDNIISGTPRLKMLLDDSNVLTLFNTGGSAAVTITPSTGKIDLMGASGAGIYSNNVPVVAVGASGTTSVSSSSLDVTGASTVNTLTVSGTTILNGQVTLANAQGDISMGLYGQ